MNNSLMVALVIGVTCGFIIGMVMMALAWQHNPQGRFHSDTGIEWANLFAVGAGWLLPVTFLVTIVAVPVLWLIRRPESPSAS